MRLAIKKLVTILVPIQVSLLLPSCVFDNYERERYDAFAEIIVSDDDSLSSNLKKNTKLYVFVNGLYDDNLITVGKGDYNLSYPSETSFTFVGIVTDSIAFRFQTPNKGEDIQNRFVEVIDYNNFPPLYYGSVTTTKISDEIMLQMNDIRSCSHVLIRNMRSYNRAEDFQVFIGGLRQAITYEGIVCGELVEKHLEGGFLETGDYWLSDKLISLPTATGEGVIVRIQRNNGEVITSRNVDDDGNIMALHPGDDVVFVITFGEHISIQVVPWTEVYSDLSL